MELIVVEWNPVPERLTLSEAIDFPPSCLPTRIITVPNEIHATKANSAKMGFYEYLAKNVGIARAKGEWILVTNPDIVFSEELYDWLGNGKFTQTFGGAPGKGIYFRADRYNFDAVQAGLMPEKPSSSTVPPPSSSASATTPASPFSFSSGLSLPRILAGITQAVLHVESHRPHGLCRRLGQGSPLGLLTYGGTQFNDPEGIVFASATVWTANGTALPEGRRPLEMCKVFVSKDASARFLVIDDTLAGDEKASFEASEEGCATQPVDCQGLHTNAPGDFLLAPTATYHSLRGFPEFHSSGTTDSLFILSLAATGLRQVVLPPPFRVFHMEHDREEQLQRPATSWTVFETLCSDALEAKRGIASNGGAWGELGTAGVAEANLAQIRRARAKATKARLKDLVESARRIKEEVGLLRKGLEQHDEL